MRDREQTIQFEMDYCQHYGRAKGCEMICKAGMDLKTTQVVPVGRKADQIRALHSWSHA